MCFKCHQKCLQTNSIILKLFSEKEVLIFWWHIQRQMDCKCTTFDKYKLNRAPRSRAFLQFVGTRLGCGGAGARGHNQSITVIDTEVMRVQITCYVTMGAPPANSLWNEGLLTARYWCWVDTCTRASNDGSRRFYNHTTKVFSWLKAPTSIFTFMILLRHYAKRTGGG